MEAIIHPGMPKTGTSSIQETLLKIKPEGYLSPDTIHGNMSGLMAKIFLDDPVDHHSMKARGITSEKMQELQAKSFERLDLRTREAFDKGLRAIFTAELISAASPSAVERLATFYRERGFQPRVIAYVRAPVSYMQSAFQQRLKGQLTKFGTADQLWPRYRNRFEKLDQIFGRENVTLKLFKPSQLKDGDVCVDFFAELGVPLSVNDVVRQNESMSLEASALLFAQRNLGEGFVQGFERATEKNNLFLAAITRIPGGKIRFKRSLVQPVYEKNREDLAWIEERLGQEIMDLPEEDGPDAIGNAADLLRIADRSRDALEDLLIAEIRKDGEGKRDRLVRNLELLRKLYY
jgi:hypothetical protein